MTIQGVLRDLGLSVSRGSQLRLTNAFGKTLHVPMLDLAANIFYAHAIGLCGDCRDYRRC